MFPERIVSQNEINYLNTARREWKHKISFYYILLIYQVISGSGYQANQIELSCSGHRLSKNIPRISDQECGK